SVLKCNNSPRSYENKSEPRVLKSATCRLMEHLVGRAYAIQIPSPGKEFSTHISFCSLNRTVFSQKEERDR
ncbi:Hypothetical predicted protein, partial [Podarcis lilfordi]